VSSVLKCSSQCPGQLQTASGQSLGHGMALGEMDGLVALGEMDGLVALGSAAVGGDDPGLDRLDAIVDLGSAAVGGGDPGLDANVGALARIEALGRHNYRPENRPGRPRFAQRSWEAAQHARLALERKRSLQKLEAASADTARARDQLARVQLCFPGVARASGIDHPAAKRLRQASGGEGSKASSEMDELRASALIRAAFLTQRVPAGLGVRHERLICFASSLVKEMQVSGLAAFMRKCAYFRSLSDQSTRNLVVLNLSHESDSTAQLMAQRAIQSFGRPSACRLTTEVFQQRGHFTCILLRVSASTGEARERAIVREPWHCHPIVMMGKSAPFVAAGLAKGMPFDIGGPLWHDWVDTLTAACDYFVLQQVGDKGSSNLPAMRHVAHCWEALPRGLSDVATCELHNLQNIKNMNRWVKAAVGRMYSFSNMMKTASFVDALSYCLVYMCHSTVRRLAMPAPQENHMENLLHTLFDFDAAHHSRSGPAGESTLMSDLRALASMPLYDLDGQELGGEEEAPRIHYCWDPLKEGPCCSSEDESREKCALAYVNYFASSSFDRVTLSRFTNVGKTRKKLLVGLANRRLFMSAAVTAAAKSVEFGADGQPRLPELAIPAEELGSGSSDHQLTHKARCSRLHAWFGSERIRYELAISEVAESVVDDLQYAFFGKGREIPTVFSSCRSLGVLVGMLVFVKCLV